jgi:hypothetical protein
MALRDLKSNMDGALSFYPVAVTADTAKDVGVDLAGYDSAAFMCISGAIVAAGLVKAVAQECDTLSGSYTDVAAGDLDGTFTNMAATSVQRVGYKGSKQFLAIRMDYTSGTSTVVAGIILRGNPERAPLA